MKTAVCAAIAFAFACTSAVGEDGEPYDFSVSSDGLLPPARRDAYGPGIDADATGRPFHWKPEAPASEPIPGHADPTLRIRPDAYGAGVGSDQYGRPVRRIPGF